MSSYFPGPPNGQDTITVGGPPAPGPEPSPSGPSSDPISSLKAAISAVRDAADAADDEVDRQVLLQCLAKIQSVLANEQKEKEAAMGTGPVHRGLAKLTRGSGGA